MIYKILFFVWKITPFYMWAVMRKQHSPADNSNRHWKPIFLWLCFTRYEQVLNLNGWKITRWQLIKRATFHEEDFVETMPFLSYDIWDLLVERLK